MRRKFFKYVWPHRFPFVVALGEVFLISMFEILKPWPFKLVIDHVLSGKPVPWQFLKPYAQETILLISCVSLIFIYLFLGGLNMLNNYTTIKIGQRMVNDLRSDLYSHLQRLSLAFYSRSQVGDLLYRVTSDTYSIQALWTTE